MNLGDDLLILGTRRKLLLSIPLFARVNFPLFFWIVPMEDGEIGKADEFKMSLCGE